MKHPIPAALLAALALAAPSCEKKETPAAPAPAPAAASSDTAAKAAGDAKMAADEAKTAAADAKDAAGTAKEAAGTATDAAQTAAIEAFKASAEEIKAWMKSKEEEVKASNDPAAFTALMSELSEKMQAIKTEGLPADLKEAIEGGISSLGKFKEISLVTDVAEREAKMAEFGAEMAATGKKLNETAAKYGVADFGSGN